MLKKPSDFQGSVRLKSLLKREEITEILLDIGIPEGFLEVSTEVLVFYGDQRLGLFNEKQSWTSQ